MSKSHIETFEKSDFLALGSMTSLKSDDYMFCCFVDVSSENCLPQADELSSCTDLMANDILRIFLWILGSLALCGNSIVLIYRVFIENDRSVNSFLISNLAIGDFFMGVYMISVASVDAYYKGVYIENSYSWRYSAFCKFLGFLSTFASEVSVFILCAITADRFINIVFPFTQKKLTLPSARICMIVIWSVAFLIGIIPVLPLDYFAGEFQARSSVCISIHLTAETSPGWEYSVAIFHFVNFTVFMFIFLAYAKMYNIVQESGSKSGSKTGAELAAARKMTLIVVTDFCCWVPINIMGKGLLCN